MTKIGAWWVTKHEARPSESLVWSTKANRTQGRGSRGGKLYLTTERLLFSPHLFDAAFGGESCSIELSSVAEVGVQPKGGTTLGGGLRDRLRVALNDGTEHLFVVNGLDAAVARIQETWNVLPQRRS
jgi:hypothetical protein